MPAFQHVLVLSALALSLSVQAAPAGIVESREFGQATDLEARAFRHAHKGPHHGVTTHIGIPEQGHDHVHELEARREHHQHRPHKGKASKGKHVAEGPAPTAEARDYEELEARGVHHPHRTHKGKASKGKHTAEGPAPTAEARDYDELDARDYDELDARREHRPHRPHKGKASKGKHTAEGPAPTAEARSLADLD